MQSILNGVLKRFIVAGRLSVRYPDGRLVTYTGRPGPEAGLEIRTSKTLRRLITDPDLAVGEAYMDGTLVPLGGTIYDVLDVLYYNEALGGQHPGSRLQTLGPDLDPALGAVESGQSCTPHTSHITMI